LAIKKTLNLDISRVEIAENPRKRPFHYNRLCEKADDKGVSAIAISIRPPGE
jgi:hypothetical protein